LSDWIRTRLLQDREIELLRTYESDWKRRHDAIQWQLTEMEQQLVRAWPGLPDFPWFNLPNRKPYRAPHAIVVLNSFLDVLLDLPNQRSLLFGVYVHTELFDFCRKKLSQGSMLFL
jgi:hypothetical protein